jgi:hypothetical protein
MDTLFRGPFREGKVNNKQVDKILDSLKTVIASWKPLVAELNRKTALTPSAPNIVTEVPAGRFAVRGADNTVDFYQIDRPTKGNYAGNVYVMLLIGSPGDFAEQRMSRTASVTILAKIEAAGIEESARLFGEKTKHCGHCMSELSVTRSRASGYGPVCASKHGYWYATEDEALRILKEGPYAE